MPGRLNNQLALVTSGFRRIGRAICRALDVKGPRLIVHCHQNLGTAQEVPGLLQSQPSVMLLQADMGSTESIFRMVDSLDSLDILVNNAGVWSKPT